MKKPIIIISAILILGISYWLISPFFIVRFEENFDVANGPDLFVGFAKAALTPSI